MATDNTTYCRKTGKPCILCMIGLIPDVLKCKNRYKKTEEESNDDD